MLHHIAAKAAGHEPLRNTRPAQPLLPLGITQLLFLAGLQINPPRLCCRSALAAPSPHIAQVAIGRECTMHLAHILTLQRRAMHSRQTFVERLLNGRHHSTTTFVP
jgi:hypothetical protein